MIIVIIICAILYLIMIYGVISLYYTYKKDYTDIEQRLLQLEKRFIDDYKNVSRQIIELQDLYVKEGDTMACGRRGRPRGSHNTTHGGRKK